jgi:UDP-glucose 4-epimerase
LLSNLLGETIEPDFQPARVGDVRESLADISLARRLLGYDPQVSLEAGLRATIDYYSHLARGAGR